jgi:hypothetical protein
MRLVGIVILITSGVCWLNMTLNLQSAAFSIACDARCKKSLSYK